MPRTAAEVSNLLIHNKDTIFSWLQNRESDVKRYFELRDIYRNGGVVSPEFRRRFSHFYRLFHMGREGKDQFFRIFVECSSHSINADDFYDIFCKVSETTGNRHLSYTSKMMHTINNDLPIYDSNVARVFGWGAAGGMEKERYELLCQKIDELLKMKQVGELINELRSQFIKIPGIEKESVNRVKNMKILDFALWALGDLI
ncbi:MAG: hypothetical protein WCJ25_04190 [Candidatus Moraniibacteriota bacterium]